MQRRDFLRLGGLSTLGLTAPPVAAAAPEPIDELAVEVAVLNLDAGVRSIRSRISQRLLDEGALAHRDDLRAAMSTLVGGYYAYQAFSDLPLDIQVHPEMQERIHRAGTDLDDGVDAMRAAIGGTTDDEWDAMERVWRAGPDVRTAATDAELSYAKHGGSMHGRRRIHGLADTIERDIHDKGLRHTLEGYFDEIDTAYAVGRARAPSPHDTARVRRAQKRWTKRGVHPVAFQRARDRNRDPKGLRVLGSVMIVLGTVIAGVGVPYLVCPCIGAPIVALGVVLIVFGAKQLRLAKALDDNAHNDPRFEPLDERGSMAPANPDPPPTP